jgi:hypothetical protein
MSTNNLARTVIEGGRSQWNKGDRKHKTASYRAHQRELLSHAMTATELDDFAVPKPPARYRVFRDKLGPPKRWLQRQAGRPWNTVRAVLFQRFDTRTTPGRHIVFCHVPPWVEDDARFFGRSSEFAIDKHGILRYLGGKRPRPLRHHESLPIPESDLERWLQHRRVAERGGALFWFTPTNAGAYRQSHRLDDRDITVWRSLPAWFRERHDPSAPAEDPRKRT